MSTSSKSPARPQIPHAKLRRMLADGRRWRILDLLLQHGAMSNEALAKGTRASKQSISKHLVFMREAGILTQGMGRLYSIVNAFRVPNERALDFGPVVLRFGSVEEKS